MKKCITIFALLFVAGLSFAQTTGLSTNENYVYTKNCLNEDCSKKTETVEYSDGLGRSKQVIGIKASPSGKDIVTPIEYDLFGRQVKSYLPIPQTGTQNGGVYTNPKSNSVQSYGSDTFFYSNTDLESSPSPKVLSRTKPGSEFQGHSVSYEYGVNANADVKKYVISTTSWVNNTTENSIPQSGTYTTGQLIKTSVTDEDGNTTIEFTNGKGQTILVRKIISATENADTYYVYNKYGQLAYTIPPLAVTATLNQTTLDNLCYQYRYDVKGRQVEKKLPGKGWEYIVYDKQDRIIMSQDANMGILKQWLFNKYDKYGRIVYTGIYTSAQNYGGNGRAKEQGNLDTNQNLNESRSTGFSGNGTTVYYTNNAYPSSFTKILSVNYYDTYPPDNSSGIPTRPTQILGNNTISDNPGNSINTKNLPTASYVKNIEDDNWTKTFLWYDVKIRAIGTHTVNHLGGYTKTETQLDFAGAVLQSKVYHRRLAGDTERIITQTFEFDAQNRLKKQWHQVGSGTKELLAENSYNELSQLSNKKVGNNLQNIDYAYTVRGSLIKLNDPANLGTKLFAYELKYQNPSNAVLSKGKYNGNIAEVTWKTAADNVLRRYSYEYDPLNRLKKGTYSEPNASVPENNFYNETIGYDLNSNIISIQRNTKNTTGIATLMDNLGYNYTGNRLNSITDTSGNYGGYPDTSGNVIAYDNNGNMKDHVDKGVLQIDYNILNLPDYVKFDKTYNPRPTSTELDYNVSTRYLYRADGTKLKKTYIYGSGKSNLETYTLTEYLDGFQYEDQVNIVNPTMPLTLKFVPTTEGYYNFENNKYIYNYQDYLGNTRLSYTKNSSGSAEIIEENNYYPFGLKHQGYNTLVGNPSYQYGYNGKELQKETGWSDYGARMYMSDIGRWGVIDPLAETSRRFSPYNYALNNPVMFIDPDGRKAAAPEAWEWNTPMNGAWGYLLAGGSSQFGSFADFLGTDSYSLFNRDTPGGGSVGGGPKTFGETTEYQDIMNMLYTPDFGRFDFKQFGAEDCCPGQGLTGILTEGGASISSGGAIGVLWYVTNTLFGSAHVPNHADWAWRYTGTKPLTLTEVKTEYKVREKNEQVGSYTIIFGNDQKYHGKGPIERMFTSAILQMTRYSTTIKSFDWTPSATDREAFKAEYRRMQTDRTVIYPQGYRNPINYNILQSPGYKYTIQDGY